MKKLKKFVKNMIDNFNLFDYLTLIVFSLKMLSITNISWRVIALIMLGKYITIIVIGLILFVLMIFQMIYELIKKILRK